MIESILRVEISARIIYSYTLLYLYMRLFSIDLVESIQKCSYIIGFTFLSRDSSILVSCEKCEPWLCFLKARYKGE